MTLEYKEKELEKILKNLGSALIAFSGGVDSTYLLYKAKKTLGNNILAVTAVSETYLKQEKKDACQITQEMGVEHIIIYTQELAHSEFSSNPPNRCYYCKTELFNKLKKIAKNRGYVHICDGANYDDTKDFRPGLQAAKETGVQSPLKKAKLTKENIRNLSKIAGLKTWDMPAAACLASRIPYGEAITEEKLTMIAAAEQFLKSWGFKLVRVRYHNKMARIEICLEEINNLINIKKEIVHHFKSLGFYYVTLDLEGYRSGSMNEVLKPEEKEIIA